MRKPKHNDRKRLLGLFAGLALIGVGTQAQTTTPNVTVEILGTGAESLLGGDLTDPENDGEDALGAATSATWNWKAITSSHESDFEGGENSFNIFDNKVGGGNDKWCCDDPTLDVPVWVSVEFNRPISLSHFTVTSGNDSPDRDPTNWAIQGSNDGTTFTDIYRFVDTTVPWDARNQVVKFTLPPQSQGFTHIRYIAWETPGTLHQINEIELFGTTAAGGAPIANGLVAYWPFNDNFEDAIGIFDGTPNGTEPIPFVAGKTAGFGKAIKLDGEDQDIEITGGEPDDLAFAEGSMSIAGWFKVDAFDTDWQALVAKGEGNNWRIHRRGGETGFAHAGGTGEGPAGGAVNDGAWHHFVAISDKDAVNFGTRLYIDGAVYTENATAPVLAANGRRMMIGENPDAVNREWEGELDDIAIWNRVLTEQEIGQLYANGTGKPLSEVLGDIPGDSDKDGIPDEAEIAYGFNPNDPTDAAKDFDGDGVSNLAEYQAGTDPVDVTKPTLVSAVPTSLNTVAITFSEDLDIATATNIANYTISPAVAVTGATYRNKVVTLTTANQTPGATAYSVAVANVRDTSKNVVAANTSAPFFSYINTKEGVLKFSFWGTAGLELGTGTAVSILTDDPDFPNNPDQVYTLYSFTSRDAFPDDSHEQYGASIEGFVSPTQSGEYRFFIHSDDASQLYLSTDATEANLAMIAEETGCCNNFTEPDGNHTRTSEPIALTAGQKYFIRLVYKEGGGGDYGRVAWRREGDTTPAGSLTPIPGQFLSAAVDLPIPAEGAFITQTPGNNAQNVSPTTPITIVHRDGQTPWTQANVSLKVDGVDVTPTFTKVGTTATISFRPPGVAPSESTHTVALTHPNPAGQPTVRQWTYKTLPYKGPTKDVVKGYDGLIIGAANATADRGGVTGNAGDYGLDLTRTGGYVSVVDPSWINTATANDELSIALWVKKHDIAASSAFWLASPSQARVFQAHTPWSDNTVYFDTAGCCDGTTQRINAGIDTFPDYTSAEPGDNSWWTNDWHFFVFTKNGEAKQIWIDGKLFLEGTSTGTLSSDVNSLTFGAEPSGANRMHGIVDDYSIYSTALTEAQVNSLFTGTLPTALPAAAGLMAYWNFNTPPVIPTERPTITVTRSGANLTIQWAPNVGTLESSPTLGTGAVWTAVGNTNPANVPITATGNRFFRVKQ